MNQPSAITNRLCKKSNKNGKSIRDRLGEKRSGVEKLVKNSHFSLSGSSSSGAHIKVKIPQTCKLTSALSILIRKRRTILASLLKTKPTNDYINSLVKIGKHSDEFLILYSPQSSNIHSRTSAANSASNLAGSTFSDQSIQQQIYRQEYQQIDKMGYQQQHLRYQRPMSNVSDSYRPQLQVQMNRNSDYNGNGSITLIVGDPHHPGVKEDEFLVLIAFPTKFNNYFFKSVFEDYGEILKCIVKKNSFFAITGATIVFRNRQDGLKVIRELDGKLVYGKYSDTI